MEASRATKQTTKPSAAPIETVASRLAIAGAAILCGVLVYDLFALPSHDPALKGTHWGKGNTAWDPAPVYDFIDSDVCTIERVPASSLSPDKFRSLYLERMPVIIVDDHGRWKSNEAFARAVQRGQILEAHRTDNITLSTGNRNSYAKRRTTLGEYVEHMLGPQPLERLGNESWYHFGDPLHNHWWELTQLYHPPSQYMLFYTPSLSFGIGATGSGVPFHTHGHVFAEIFYGRKRWWIAAPSEAPRYDPDASTLQWLRHVRPTYSTGESASLLECVCGPGDLLYIPSNWHHATLNIGQAVFVSVFV